MKKTIALAFIAGFLVSCGGMAYRLYAPVLPNDDCYHYGKALANDPKNDRNLDFCMITAGNKMPCILAESTEIELMLQRIKTLEIQLKEAQDRCDP